jgi:hypothetical protein
MTTKDEGSTEAHDGGPKRARMPFWPAAVDDAGLDVYTARLLAHVIRRAGASGEYFESRRRAADVCLMSERRVFRALPSWYGGQCFR